MEVQVYGEAWLKSMFMVRCQVNEPWLGLRSGFWKAIVEGYCYAYTYGPSLLLVGLCNSVSGLQ